MFSTKMHILVSFDNDLTNFRKCLCEIDEPYKMHFLKNYETNFFSVVPN